MITLQMIHETINRLRDQAAELHQNTLYMSDDELHQWAYEDHATWPLDSEPPRPGKPEWAYSGYAANRAECARLAMAWHDVVRGCRTDEELHMRLAEHALAAVVRAFAADSEREHPPQQKLYYCCSPRCPGYSYRASEWAHPRTTCIEVGE